MAPRFLDQKEVCRDHGTELIVVGIQHTVLYVPSQCAVRGARARAVTRARRDHDEMTCDE